MSERIAGKQNESSCIIERLPSMPSINRYIDLWPIYMYENSVINSTSSCTYCISAHIHV